MGVGRDIGCDPCGSRVYMRIMTRVAYRPFKRYCATTSPGVHPRSYRHTAGAFYAVNLDANALDRCVTWRYSGGEMRVSMGLELKAYLGEVNR